MLPGVDPCRGRQFNMRASTEFPRDSWTGWGACRSTTTLLVTQCHRKGIYEGGSAWHLAKRSPAPAKCHGTGRKRGPDGSSDGENGDISRPGVSGCWIADDNSSRTNHMDMNADPIVVEQIFNAPIAVVWSRATEAKAAEQCLVEFNRDLPLDSNHA